MASRGDRRQRLQRSRDDFNGEMEATPRGVRVAGLMVLVTVLITLAGIVMHFAP